MIRKILAFALVAVLAYSGAVSAFTISGSITGGQTGLTLKWVVGVPTTLDTIYLTAALPFVNSYALTNVQPGGYLLFSFQDLNTNLRPDLDEPRGFYGGTYPQVLTISRDTSGVNIELQPPNNGGFTGTVTYGATRGGATIIAAFDNASLTGTPRGAGAVLDTTGAGDYIAFVDTFGTYYAYAFMDLNLNFSYDPDEPYGFYGTTAPQPFTVQQTNFPDNINITLNDPSAAPEVVVLPNSPLLISVYPNPFNNSTRLNFTLDRTIEVELSAFNLLGQRVAQIMNGRLPAGEHAAYWNAAGMPSGVYMIRLQTEDRISTTKALLMK
jgi:hypothetical protein